MKFKTIALLIVRAMVVLCAAAPALASSRPDSHAPIGVMGDHTHNAGEIMLSYRYMRMEMDGNGDGTDDLSATEIATTANNPFFGMPGMPPTLRIVPLTMEMEMHMLGAMWAPTDRVTLMAMTHYVRKEMDHVTFMGGMGTNVLGRFTTKSSGFADSSLSALIELGEHQGHTGWHATVGVGLPTGSVDETGRPLTPMNMRPRFRLPYAMQLGSETTDLIGGLTYNALHERWGWGAQWRSRIALEENAEDYHLGDEHKFSAWVSRRLGDQVSTAVRLQHVERDSIEGQDPQIRGPVQTADPDRYGHSRTEIGFSLNWHIPDSAHRLAAEVLVPVREDLDGPQMQNDWTLVVGWQINL